MIGENGTVVLGLDPGLRRTGWGAVRANGSRLTHLGDGVVEPAGSELATRLASLYDGLREIVERIRPDRAAVEHVFVNADAVGTLKLAQARAIALLVPAQFGAEVAEYAPNAVKRTVVGVGHADKQQVDHMIRMLFPKAELKRPDAADALALAACDAYQSRGAARRLEALAGGRR